MQTGVVIGAEGITGTLKYVTGYTGWSGEVEEQSGNYLAINFTATSPDSIVVEKIVGGEVVGSIDATSDKYLVYRVTDTANTKLRITATKGTDTESLTYDLKGLVLESE